MRRRRRKKTKKLASVSLISITTIAMLNILGISYAYWNEGADITTLVATGNIDPYFKRLRSWEYKYCHEKVSVKIVDDDTIRIDGTVEPGYEGVFMYVFKNDGTIPVVSEEDLEYSCDEAINFINKGGKIGPNNNGRKKGLIVIKPKCDDIGEYTIDEEIEIEQMR